MASKFTQKAQNALNSALAAASELGHSYIGSEHLLLGLLSVTDSAASKLLTSRGVTADAVRASVISITGTGSPGTLSPSDMTPRTKKIIEGSAHLSIQNGGGYVGTEHLLLSMLSERDCVAVRIIDSLGISPSEIADNTEAYIRASPISRSETYSSKGQNSDRSDKNILLQYGRDLTEQARKGRLDPIIGRQNETEAVIQILSRRTKNNPCLVGEPGVGKTAVIEGLASRIANGNVPDLLREKKVISLDMASMIAGAKYRGEFEERMKKVLAEAENDPNVVIFIDEVHTTVGAGAAEGAVDAANILKPALARGNIQVIGATTLAEYHRHIEKDAALERRFQPVTVGEPSREETVRILEGLRTKFEAHHTLSISDDAIKAAVELSVRYIPDRFLPDKAIDLLDEAAARLKLKIFTSPPEHKMLEYEIEKTESEKTEAITEQDFELAASLRDKEKELRETYRRLKLDWESRVSAEDLILTEGDIAEIVTQRTGIPLSELMEDESLKLGELESRLSKLVIGQENAIKAVVSSIRRSRLGLGDPRRPISSFIFAGGTGVGKTELCRALVSVLFGDEGAMIRLDMSEYMEKHSVSRLIGSPPGYVGYGEGGLLTEKVRRRPYSLVLFDEIEKAHPDIFNLLLQLLDDGILTDPQGRRINFRNTLIVMTTNLGAKKAGRLSRVGFSASDDLQTDEGELLVKEELRKTFSPEFLNRIDDIVVFNPLSISELERIASLLISALSDRVESRGIFIEFDQSIAHAIARSGKDTDYGARPLRRELTRLAEIPLSEAMLSGKIKKGDHLRAFFDGRQVVFEK